MTVQFVYLVERTDGDVDWDETRACVVIAKNSEHARKMVLDAVIVDTNTMTVEGKTDPWKFSTSGYYSNLWNAARVTSLGNAREVLPCGIYLRDFKAG